jgi:uncharacterized protein (DUF488 family)
MSHQVALNKGEVSTSPGLSESMDRHDETISLPTRMLTVGHSTLPMPAFLELLQVHEVQRLVDVRSAPYSRFAPHFNREALAATLQEEGIEYGYAGDYLGGRPKDPTCYFAGEVPEAKANYLELVNYEEVARRDWYLRGIARLLERAQQGVTAILCSEEDPSRCHRHHLIARTLLDRGVDVLHIRANGSLEPAPITEERIADEVGGEQLSLFDSQQAQ